MTAVGFTIGGCWYRLQARERLVASIASLAYLSGQMGAPFLGMRVMHTSNLWTGRCEWLNREIQDARARWSIAVDSDTSFDAHSLMASLPRMDSLGVAIGCAPIRVGGTNSTCNLNLRVGDETRGISDGRQPSGEHRATAKELRAVLEGDGEIASGGFGLAIFHLDWFREHWPKPVPEVIPNNWGEAFVGEDIAFCRSVRRRGGKILALPINAEHHEFKP